MKEKLKKTVRDVVAVVIGGVAGVMVAPGDVVEVRDAGWEEVDGVRVEVRMTNDVAGVNWNGEPMRLEKVWVKP